MKKTNRLKYWEDELKKYGDVGGVGVVKPSNPPSLTPPGNSKNTDSKNPLDIYNDYIKESNTPSAPDLVANPKLPHLFRRILLIKTKGLLRLIEVNFSIVTLSELWAADFQVVKKAV